MPVTTTSQTTEAQAEPAQQCTLTLPADLVATVYVDSPKLLEEIRCLKATIDVHLNTLRAQGQKAEHDAERLATQGRTIKTLLAENKALAILLRERDWTLATYREKFEVIVEKIEDLTPDCEHSVNGDAICPSCAGTGAEGARPDDRGHRFTCRKCNGSGKVKCSECGEGADHG